MTRTSFSRPQNSEGYSPRQIPERTMGRVIIDKLQYEPKRSVGRAAWKVIKSYVGGLVTGEVKPMSSSHLLIPGPGVSNRHEVEIPARQLTPHTMAESEASIDCKAMLSHEPLGPDITEQDLTQPKQPDQAE